MTKKKLFKKVLLFIIVILVGIFLYHRFGWRTYTNTTDNYTIQVPASYYGGVENEAVRYTGNYSAGWIMGDPSEKLGAKCYFKDEEIHIIVDTMEQYKNALDLYKYMHMSKPEGKQTTIGLLTAFWYNNQTSIEFGPIMHSGKVFTFRYHDPCVKPDNYHFPEHLDQFIKILASFKFTN